MSNETYITKQGDMWDSIAYNQLGSCEYTGALLAINSRYSDTYIFPAGIELKLPGIENSTSKDLPPWKAGNG